MNPYLILLVLYQKILCYDIHYFILYLVSNVYVSYNFNLYIMLIIVIYVVICVTITVVIAALIIVLLAL